MYSGEVISAILFFKKKTLKKKRKNLLFFPLFQQKNPLLKRENYCEFLVIMEQFIENQVNHILLII